MTLALGPVIVERQGPNDKVARSNSKAEVLDRILGAARETVSGAAEIQPWRALKRGFFLFIT